MSYNDRGNILFLILLAVVLFAALSYAVTNSLRGGGKNASSEKISAQAAQIIQYATLIQNTVNRLILINNCTEAQLSFENSIVSGYTNASAPTKCKVFDQAGGGLSWFTPDTAWLDSSGSNPSSTNYGQVLYTTRACVPAIGSTSSTCTTADVELFLFIPYLKQELCFELAKKTDVLNASGAIPIDTNESYDISSKFIGSYAQTGSITNLSGLDSGKSLDGKYNGCFQSDDDSTKTTPLSYNFYQVLLAR